MPRHPNLELVDHQIGTAIVNVNTGKVERGTGQMTGEKGEKATRTMYNMIGSIAEILEGDPLKRVTITLTMCQFVMVIWKEHLYIAKKKLDVV